MVFGSLGTTESCTVLMVPSFGYEGKLPRSKLYIFLFLKYIVASNLFALEAKGNPDFYPISRAL